MRPEIMLVGTGPGPLSALTGEARACLEAAGRVLFRMSGHPVYEWLRDRGVDLVAFDLVYATPKIRYNDVYELITESVLKEAERRGQVIYALPGHPFVLEHTSSLIAQRAGARGIDVAVIPGVSFLEIVSGALRIDLAGVQICNAVEFESIEVEFKERGGLLIGGLAAPATPSGSLARHNIDTVARWLRRRFPGSHPIALAWTSAMPAYVTRTARVPLRAFDKKCRSIARGALAAAYVPPLT